MRRILPFDAKHFGIAGEPVDADAGIRSPVAAGKKLHHRVSIAHVALARARADAYNWQIIELIGADAVTQFFVSVFSKGAASVTVMDSVAEPASSATSMRTVYATGRTIF
jgi:hypothetical protein